MFVFDAPRTRQLVVRAVQGERLHDVIQRVAAERKARAAWIGGAGILAWVDLTTHDVATKGLRAVQRIDGPLQIGSLVGTLGTLDGSPTVELQGTFALGGSIDQVVAGVVRDSEVIAAELTLAIFDDLTLEREYDQATGVHVFRPLPPQVTAAAVASAAQGSWASVARTIEAEESTRRRQSSAPVIRRPISSVVAQPLPEIVVTPQPIPERKRSNVDSGEHDPIPETGDYIDHEQFGLCKVEGEDDDGATRIRLPSGSLRSIRFDYLRVREPREEDGKKIFPVEPKRR